jgi:diacylglycerol kinase (ATP)
MAHQLDVPLDLKEAAQLILSSRKRRAIDLASLGDKVWMLRVYTGISPEEAASRELKDKYGQLSYIQASYKILTNMKSDHYRAVVDGEVIEGEALICLILNAGSIGGVLGMSLPQVGGVDISDGCLDLYAVTKNIQPLRALSHHFFDSGESQAGVYHWQGKEITLEADPPQDVWIDGDIDGKTPFTTKVIPEALEFVVPE